MSAQLSRISWVHLNHESYYSSWECPSRLFYLHIIIFLGNLLISIISHPRHLLWFLELEFVSWLVNTWYSCYWKYFLALKEALKLWKILVLPCLQESFVCLSRGIYHGQLESDLRSGLMMEEKYTQFPDFCSANVLSQGLQLDLLHLPWTFKGIWFMLSSNRD